jgi:cobalamin-dependent methionine synthase I
MLAAAAAGLEGWQVTDLGVDLPVSEIARAARAVGARAVALSVVRSDLAETASRDAAELRRALPGAVALIVGGRGSERLDPLRLSPGVQVVGGLDAFRTALGRLG